MKDIISARNISKVYRINHRSAKSSYNSIGEIFQNKINIFSKNKSLKAESDTLLEEDFYALRDVEFDISHGERVGIIGRNGAGKSTLLKILGRIVEPSTGSIRLKGRVASLLEVGTGFHPELTGRENIFLNGSILGMTQSEIKRKFDAIVSFAEVERFLDTPVKRYSSGMYVRLAFAVAAHLEPEILIVDEVLAVGDAEFQKKCLGKMEEVSNKSGRTVLFVSHNMAAIKSLCDRAIFLDKGRVAFDGGVEKAIQKYLGSNGSFYQNQQNYELGIPSVFQLNAIEICNVGRGLNDPVSENIAIELVTDITILSNYPERYSVTYHLFNDQGEALFSFGMDRKLLQINKGRNRLVTSIPEGFLQSGNYSLSFFFVEDSQRAIYIENHIFYFSLVDGSRDLGVYMGKEPGYVRPRFPWQNQIA